MCSKQLKVAFPFILSDLETDFLLAYVFLVLYLPTLKTAAAFREIAIDPLFTIPGHLLQADVCLEYVT